VIFLYGCKTWERNWDWKNDITLFIKDANTMPNSVLVLGNAGARWIDLSKTKYFNKKAGEQADIPFPGYDDKLLDFRVSEAELKDGINTKDSILLSPQSIKGKEVPIHERSLYKGIACLKHAVELHPRYTNGYLNLGLAYFHLQRDREALYYWKRAEKLYPNNPYLKSYYISYYNQLLQQGYQKAVRGRSDSAAIILNKCIILDRLNPEGWYSLGAAYYNLGHYKRSKQCWEEALKLNPNHPQAQQAIKNITPQMLGATVAPVPIRKG
jgi:tetratricopeptide (TPR) repeat protein